ncbi:MAG TPA: tetratricopeptide repeat protein [Verrucomicrobiae bacterium]|nr:tetratricopeptide repeat protein [Verrucomicrobiae bacterium]
MKKLLTLLAVFLFAVPVVWGQENDPKKLFAEANRLYDAQNYLGAIQLYEQLTEQGVRTPALYYNLASAHFKTKAIGQSVLYLLRAQKLSPGDDDIEGNLRFVSQFTIDKGTLSSPPLAFFTELFPLGTWALWGTVYYFLFTGIITLRIWFKSRAFLLRWGTWLVGILLGVFALGFYLSWSWSKVPKGVLIAKEAPVKSGPGEDFVTQLLGHEGLTFQILEKREDYLEVLLPNGVKGWVKKEEAAKV